MLDRPLCICSQQWRSRQEPSRVTQGPRKDSGVGVWSAGFSNKPITVSALGSLSSSVSFLRALSTPPALDGSEQLPARSWRKGRAMMLNTPQKKVKEGVENNLLKLWD